MQRSNFFSPALIQSKNISYLYIICLINLILKEPCIVTFNRAKDVSVKQRVCLWKPEKLRTKREKLEQEKLG